MIRLPRSARAILMCASMLTAASSVAPARAAPATPEQAAAIQEGIQSFYATMLGANVAGSLPPVHIAPDSDHYAASLDLAPGKAVTASVTPAANGAYTFDKLHYPTPAQFTVTMPVSAASGGREVRLTYGIKVAEQSGSGTIDPTLATQSTATTTVRGLDVSVEGGADMNSVSHIGRATGQTTVRPAGDDRVDVITSSAIEDYTTNTTAASKDKPIAVRFSAGKATVSTEIDGMSRERAPQVMQLLVQIASGAMAAGPARNGGPPAIGMAPVRALLTAMEGAATSGKLDETVEGLHVVADNVTVDLDRVALALAGLAPLKTVVPYTIEVDRQTGYVEMVKGLKPGPLSETSAVTQSFLVQYVIARETFDAADLRDNYRKVTLWSAGEARNAYENDLKKTNPSSPLNLYSPTTIVSTTIDSVSLLSPTTALVRFETVRRDSGGSLTPQGAFVAVMAFRYIGAPMRMEDRFINPLGFQVISYRRDSDSVALSPPRIGQAVPITGIPGGPPFLSAPAFSSPAPSTPPPSTLPPSGPLSRPPFIGPMPR